MKHIKVLEELRKSDYTKEQIVGKALDYAIEVLKRLEDEVEIKRVICNAENKCVDGFNSTKYMDLDVRDRWENIASALQDYLRGER